jgi:hypothetical protein
MEPINCPETSMNQQHMLRNILEELKPQLHCSGNQKRRKTVLFGMWEKNE